MRLSLVEKLPLTRLTGVCRLLIKVSVRCLDISPIVCFPKLFDWKLANSINTFYTLILFRIGTHIVVTNVHYVGLLYCNELGGVLIFSFLKNFYGLGGLCGLLQWIGIFKHYISIDFAVIPLTSINASDRIACVMKRAIA